MFRFGMSRDDECERCGLKETYRHLFWECVESRRVWLAFNDYMTRINNSQFKVESYEEIFNISTNRILSMIKVRVIQAMIQIERPRGWKWDTVRKYALELKMLEIYNSKAKNKLDFVKMKWHYVR